jgi:CBS domain-containing protein
MQNNTISYRIYDFLKEYAPFNLLKKNELIELSSTVVVKYFPQGQAIFKEGDSAKQHFYIIREGLVELHKEIDHRPTLVDIREEGDLIGLRPMFVNEPYVTTAAAKEDSLLYAIDVKNVRKYLENDPKIALFFARSFATGISMNLTPERKEKLQVAIHNNKEKNAQLTEIQQIEVTRRAYTCFLDTPIKEAAQLMADRETSLLVVVNDRKHPIGVIRDVELRKHVVTGKVKRESPIETIYVPFVVTASRKATIVDISILQVKNRVNHILITENGTKNSPVIGIYAEHDIIVQQGNTPSSIMAQINNAETPNDLKNVRNKADLLIQQYLLHEVSIPFISSIITEINDNLIFKSILIGKKILSEENITIKNIKFAWISLGSGGREEQILRTDQDNAIIFEDVSEEELSSVRNYFLRLAHEVNRILKKTGFKYCPAEMMARNPKWCLSLSEWKTQFSEWIDNPDSQNMLYANVFFDFRPSYGDFALTEALAAHIFQKLEQNEGFFIQLAKVALYNPPPLSFFKNFMVEKDGAHKDEFDIKVRAMRPLIDAARVLILNLKQPKINNTFKRFEKLAELDPPNKDLYESAADAFEILMRTKALKGLKNNNSGRYFKPEELNKLEKMMLKDCFTPIRDLQQLLSVRFRL